MKRILVVEDDSTLAASMVQGLKAEPFEVELCVRGDLAYEKSGFVVARFDRLRT